MQETKAHPSTNLTVDPSVGLPAHLTRRPWGARGRHGTLARSLGAALAALVLAVLIWPPASASSQPHRDASPSKLAEHAEKTYAATFTRYKTGLTDVEEVYTWSVRWLDAELRTATASKAKKKAFAAHQTRMRDLRNQVKSLFGIGTAPAVAVHAADYYATQAALWRSSLTRD